MQNHTQPPFIIVDGSSYLYRAFHALPAFTNAEGFPTNAIYGVINMLRRLVKTHHPKHMVVVFDAKGKTFRHELYPQYKAHRPPMPEDLRVQIEPLHQIIRAMHIPILSIAGVEADDVIGTLAKQASEQNMQTLISTGDKDLAQLVNEHVTLINTMTDTYLDQPGVEKKFGVPPTLMIDYLALMGDKSDNVPGIPKVGPKTAVKWLTQYGSLDNVVAHADAISGKIGENLRHGLNQLALSKQLVTIRCDCPLDIHVKDLIDKPDDNKTLLALFQKFQLNSFIKELKNDTPNNSKTRSTHYTQITNEATLDQWVQTLQNATLIAIDTETTSLDSRVAKIVGISCSIQPNHAIYIPIAHDYAGAPTQLNREKVLQKLKPILENPTIQKVGHNLKYDQSVFANHQIYLKGVAFDTMLESYILNSIGSRHDLDSLALKYLDIQTIHYEDVAGKGAKQIPFAQVPLEQATPYAAEDADITLQLHHYFWPKIQSDEKLLFVFSTLEMPLIDVLVNMERKGVFVNADILKKQGTKIQKRLTELEEKAYQLADTVFNLNSPQQLREILFERLKIPPLNKTPTGQPSTAEPVLQELALDHPLPKVILEHRSLSKLQSTYVERLPEQICPLTQRIHTSYHQAVTSTGRLSSSHPNLQNIPIRTNAGREIRQAFEAPAGYQLLAADYSQMELRIMAHLSQDPGLLSAFSKGLDIHTSTASEVFGLAHDDVDYDHRRKAKAINFGLLYGMSAFGLAKQLGVTRVAAQTYMDAYFARYPQVKTYMDEIQNFAKQNGYVETLYGRRLYTPNINAKNKLLQKAAIRAAINAPMQGTVADIIKLAMIQIHQCLKQDVMDVAMIIQVHDELVFEVAEKDLEAAEQLIEEQMIHVVKLSVPLAIEIGIGSNWDEAH